MSPAGRLFEEARFAELRHEHFRVDFSLSCHAPWSLLTLGCFLIFQLRSPHGMLLICGNILHNTCYAAQQTSRLRFAIIEALLHELRNPDLPISFRDLSGVILPVSVTLLGLVYAGLIYWFQGTIERLKYAAELLEDVISANGKIILDLLVGASLVGGCGLIGANGLASACFWATSILITIDVCRLLSAQGYLETISTAKSIPPRFGSFRRGLRQARNAGFLNWAKGLAVFLPTVCYPLYVGAGDVTGWRISPAGLSVFLLTTMALSLLKLRSLLLGALAVRDIIKKRLSHENQESAQSLAEPEIEWSEKEREVERRIVVEELKAVGVLHDFEHPSLMDADSWLSRDIEDAPVMLGAPIVRADGTCHINLVAKDFSTAEALRNYIFEWTRTILIRLLESKTGIHYFVLSFSRSTKCDKREHLAMLRTTRGEGIRAGENARDDAEFVKKLSGVFLSDGITP